MPVNDRFPVLMLGGSGSLGSRTARILRRLHPDLPLTIVGRDSGKASALAEELSNADVAGVDLGRADLGLADDAGYSLVLTAVRDHSLNTLRFAEARGIPYVALSDAAFEIAPLVARYVHRPAAASILMLGHSMGAVPTLAALHLAHAFERIEAIEIGLVFDPRDPLSPMSFCDMERIAAAGPSPLLLQDGTWRWATAEEAARHFVGVGGVAHQGQAVGLVDVLSLATATEARSVRVDVAEAVTASSRAGGPPSHEVIIEITGRRADGSGRSRIEIVDPAGYAAMSAVGVALAVERLLGLAGSPPVQPGLYLPEVLIDPAYLVNRLEEFGMTLRRE